MNNKALPGFLQLCLIVLLSACSDSPPPGTVCGIFPADNIWNTAVDGLPVDANSSTYIATFGTACLHAGFAAAPGYGIPFLVVDDSQPDVDIEYTLYPDESDAGPFPIPLDAPIEGGPEAAGDRHVLVVDADACLLYELFQAYPGDECWEASCGAKFDLTSNALRPDGCASADAAGLPVFAGLVRYEEVAAGEIPHALRFCLSQVRNAHVWPARLDGHSAGLQYPPMGQRFRLKADYDLSGFSAANQVILRALKTYGMMLADAGSDLYLSGTPDERWDDEDLAELTRIKASDFEAIDVSGLMVDGNSAQVKD